MAGETRQVLTIHNPATGDPVGQVPLASPAAVAAAVARARDAQPEWEAAGLAGRRRVLARFHDLLFEHRDRVLDTRTVRNRAAM
jgi:succinate-semialdehyde dehydrogenase/glutarate-semialdehyde dehydrogenase